MDVHAWIAVGTLVAATVLFIWRPIPLAMTALSIPVVLYATGVLEDADDALRGFGNHALIAIGSVMIIGGALRESGVASLVARGITRVAGRSELGLMLLFMTATALLAAVMNNTAVVAIFLPVAAALSKRSGVSPSRLFMPMAFAAVLGGTISLIGTAPNMLVAELWTTSEAGQGGPPIGVFDFAQVGIPITVVGILYMAFVGRRFLPTRAAPDAAGMRRRPEDVARTYDLPHRLFEMRVVPGSTVVGQAIADTPIRAQHGLDVLAVIRPGTVGRSYLQPEPGLRLQVGDRLVLEGAEEEAWGCAEDEGLQFGLAAPDIVERLLERGTSLAEVTLTPYSEAVGQSFKTLGFRTRFGLNVLGLWRRGERIERGLADLELEAGDCFLVSGRPRGVAALAGDSRYVVLTDATHREQTERAPLAIGILLLALLPPVLFGFPLAVSALGAAVLMVFTGCLAKRSVRRTIDWGVLALIAGTLPLGAALEQRQVSAAVATLFTGLASGGGEMVVYSLLFLLAMVFSVLTSNAAAAVIVAPVALAAAAQSTADPRAALLATAYGCSCNFLLPFAQCNLLVMRPGATTRRTTCAPASA